MLSDELDEVSELMELIGTIARLQVQRRSPKMGERPRRWYDPSPLVQRSALTVTPSGVVGEGADGQRIVDVHNREHPDTKFVRDNAVSVGFTEHYRRMRARFADHLADGVAGENILVASDHAYLDDDLAGGLVIETGGGQRVLLEQIRVAEPCVEFSRFALQVPPETPSDGVVREALDFLRRGLRGFYASYAGAPVTLRVGDRVYLAGDAAPSLAAGFARQGAPSP
jgi:hypothetical protein